MSQEPIVRVENLEVFYGASQILFGVSFAVNQGDTLALLGRNGAGKSTTFKSLIGLVPPRSGSVRIMGQEIQGSKPYRIAARGLGYVPEDRQIFPDHSVEDNLSIAAKKGPQGQDHWNLERVYEIFPLLQPLRNRSGGHLSGGEQQMLSIARTLMGNPEVLLLDEPSEGLAPVIVQLIGNLIKTLRQMGVTIILAEQNMRFCLGIANHAVVIDKGEIVYQDTIEALKANEQITKNYLAV